MIPRSEPRVVPERPHYVEIDEAGRSWAFRLPPERKRLGLIKLVGSAAVDDPDIEQQLDQAAMLGVVIGRCWFDREFDLEPVENGDPRAYGHAVNDALYEAGHDLGVVASLGQNLLRRMQDALVGREAVEDAVGFSKAPPSGGTAGND